MHNQAAQYRIKAINIDDPVTVELKQVGTGNILEMTVSEVITDKDVMGGLPSRDALLINAWNGE